MRSEDEARNEYELQEFEKLRTVLRAAVQNGIFHKTVMIKTMGYQPSASISIGADLLAKWLKMEELVHG